MLRQNLFVTALRCLASALAAVAVGQAQPMTEVVLHNFSSPPKGANPYATLLRDSAGNLYGTAYYGGASNSGAVYKVDPSGHLTALYSFTGGSDGGEPFGGVVADSAGNLYGTTLYGGAANAGVVYKLDTTGHETVLYSFSFSDADGQFPYSGLIRDDAGNLYGTTSSGGTEGGGVIYKLDPSGQFTVLYSFTAADGGTPYAGVVRDAAGNLYGTTESGGTANLGVVYKLDSTGHYTVLYNFTGLTGATPWAGVIRDSAGNLFGTTNAGGRGGAGVVYKLDAAGQETVLYSFTGGADGGGPAGVVRDSAGNVYGTTYGGGEANAGVVFKVDTAGHETVLHSFTGGADGSSPFAGLTQDPAGNLFGTTNAGGAANIGVVFELDTTGQETVLRSFPGGEGSRPYAGLTRDPAGNLYGTACDGGTWDLGVVYKLDASGHYTVLHSFAGGADGANPRAGVILDSAGNLYGTTFIGGTGNTGVVFKLDAAGHETTLYSFTDGDDGGYPESGVVLDSSGNLYGTTIYGGAGDQGVVYKRDVAGQYTVLYSFPGGANDQGAPYGGVVLDSTGNLYGTTFLGGASEWGTVYKINAAGQYSLLYSFTGESDGGFPMAGVILDSAGNLYGTTEYGGAAGGGVVYKLDPAGNETVLYSFESGAGGEVPLAGVIRDSGGNLYGTTQYGGPADAGVVYKVDTTGQETVPYTFTAQADGGTPYAGLIGDSAGNLYGTTFANGKFAAGVVFKLTPQ
jgi:uncharacterized repeat protein (TIGR03803 family)